MDTCDQHQHEISFALPTQISLFFVWHKNVFCANHLWRNFYTIPVCIVLVKLELHFRSITKLEMKCIRVAVQVLSTWLINLRENRRKRKWKPMHVKCMQNKFTYQVFSAGIFSLRHEIKLSFSSVYDFSFSLAHILHVVGS